MAMTRWDPYRVMGRWDPWRELNMLRQAMSGGDEALNRREEGFMAPAWIPPVDVYETPEAIVLKAEVPGVSRDDIDIQVERNVLTLRGERKEEHEVKEENFYRIERQTGGFFRSFTLPHAVQAEKIQATMKDGILELRLPKAEDSKPRKIKVG